MTKYLLALALSTQVLTAWAQDSDTDADDDAQNTEEEAADLGRVQVTGSLLKREDFTSTSPMQVINAETQFQAGQLTVAEILQSTTIAAGTTQLNNQFGGFVVQGGTGTQTLNLRGLGADRTLLLFNGRRVGPSGTRGEVNNVDLATIPDIAVQRIELVLDGSSSIYGSDAVAGVANVITRRSVDGTEISATADIPLDSGGEFYQAGIITGLNFDNGSITFSGQYTKNEALLVRDRDYLGCERDLFTDAAGNIIDREDRSITAGTEVGGCLNLYANTVIDALFGDRYIPSPDGVTIGPLAGYRPRANGRYDDPNGEAFYEDVLNFDFVGNETARNELERMVAYATADFTFGNVDWDADILYSNRRTERIGWRQFFPLIGGANAAALTGNPGFAYANDPSYIPIDDPLLLQLSQPVLPYPLNSEQDVDFFQVSTGLSGVLNTNNFWEWSVYGLYSRSDGDYSQNAIDERRSGDVRFDADPPTYNPYDPRLLSGEGMMDLINAVGADTTGNTVYEQWLVNAVLAGELFELPAGMLGAAIGFEHRDFTIDDVPPELAQTGNSWGLSSATVTEGSNDVSEIFTEIEVPILANLPGIESLTFNGSARYFDYANGGDDVVWKAGLNWQIIPSLRLRATAGTSYRAPALYEQFLGDQTAFADQNAVDPCIEYGESTNEILRRNCAAVGIPPDYAGGGSSALITTGGGVDNLEAETSDSFTAGFVWTPEFTNLSVAVDYYEIEVNDQIAQLGGGSISSGCYIGENFPNAFCDLLVRAPADDPVRPNQIISINDSFVNINSQTVKGVDLNLVWSGDFDWGQFLVESQTTYQLENIFQLFDPSLVAGFEDQDVIGDIGNPELVTNLVAQATKDDWTVTYRLQYASETDQTRTLDEQTTYFGFDPAFRDITMDAWISHSLTLFYQQDKWDALIGVVNLFDEEPDIVSGGAAATRGNTPINASQASLLGRRIQGRLNFRF